MKRRRVPMKKPRGEREPDDAYLTPRGHAISICRWLDSVLPRPERIIEPSAGSGSFVWAAREVWPKAHIVAVDVREDCRRACLAAGANEFHGMPWEEYADYQGGRGVNLILGNPPFLRAEEHIRLAYRELLDGAACSFLLRGSFWSGQRRAREFWPKHSPFAWAPIADRPSFTPDGATDGAEYGVWVWLAGFNGAPRVGRHIWSEEALKRNSLRLVQGFGEGEG